MSSVARCRTPVHWLVSVDPVYVGVGVVCLLNHGRRRRHHREGYTPTQSASEGLFLRIYTCSLIESLVSSVRGPPCAGTQLHERRSVHLVSRRPSCFGCMRAAATVALLAAVYIVSSLLSALSEGCRRRYGHSHRSRLAVKCSGFGA